MKRLLLIMVLLTACNTTLRSVEFANVFQLAQVNGIGVYNYTWKNSSKHEIKFELTDKNQIAEIMLFTNYGNKVIMGSVTGFIYFRNPANEIFSAKIIDRKYIIFNDNYNKAFKLTEQGASYLEANTKSE